MAYRRTLRRDVGCTGIGLHTGRPVRLRLLPAPAEQGIVFRRVDVGVDIPARIESLAHLDHATTLQHRGVTASTVEHLLSALRALGVDDVTVEIDGPEVPILDGSASPFVILIHEAGLRPLPVPRRYLKVLSPIEVVRGTKWMRLTPSDQLRVTYTIGFDHPLLRHQDIDVKVSAETYVEQIAGARTFGFLREVELLRRNGLALGGSLDNAVVIGESGVLNNRLRFSDEFVRHKVLDAVGDLALLGHPLLAHVEAWHAGHALHAAAAQQLLASPEAWTLVPYPPQLAPHAPVGEGTPLPSIA